jgi:mRNA interferase RelE/StbE
MDSYEVLVKQTAERELRRLPPKDIGRVARRLRSLAANPRPIGCEKLSGEDRYRVRQGVYRVVYGIDDAARRVTVVKIGHRKEVYR